MGERLQINFHTINQVGNVLNYTVNSYLKLNEKDA